MTTAEIATRLNAKKNGNGYIALCPAHPDKTPSLSISEGRNGGILLFCHAGCAPEAIVAAMGIRLADLMPAPTSTRQARPPARKRRAFTSPKEAAQACTPQGAILEALYLYPKNGQPFGAVARYKTPTGKSFLQFHATPAGWTPGWTPGAPAGKWPLFGAIPATGQIYVVEGEKCQLAAAGIGLAAVTSAGGSKAAAKSDWTALSGRDVLILPDHDTPGEAYADEVSKILTSLKPPATVKIIRLPGLTDGQDIVDFMENRDAAEPATIRKEILDLVEKIPERMPADAEQPPADKSKVYFNAGGKSFLAPDDRGGWIPMSETQVKRSLRNQGVESAIPRGEHVSEIDRELLKIQTTQNVDYAGPLAGHRAGVIEIENRRILVTESPRIIEPTTGDWITLKTVMTGLLGDVQLPFLLGWIKVACEVLRVGKRMPGQALAIAGPRDCGKSLLQNLITPILGGRCARPYQYMTDGSPFNAHLFGAEHLMVEDEVPSTDLRARRAFGAQLKSITVNLEAQCHAKGQTPLMLRPFWRLTITLNDEPENLMVLPPIDESIFDKIILLKASEQSMPMPTGTITEREAFWAQLISELPAFLAYLIDWQIPANMKSQRFGITHYHHPDLVFALAELAPEHRLLSLIDGYLFGGMDQWTGTAEGLERELTGSESACRHEAAKLFTFNTAAGTYLGRLAKRYPARFETLRKENHRVWTIKSKECTE